MSETPQNPPPGFYPDSSGVRRWWDGNAWTDRTEGPPTAQQPPAASPGTPTATATNPRADKKADKAYAKASRPWYKKKRWIAALVLVAIVAITAATSGGSSDGGAEKVNGEGSSDSSNNESDSNKAGSKSNPIKIRETVKLEGTQYTVEKAEVKGEVGGQFSNEKANGVYVIVTLTIENKKDETKTFLDSAAKFVASNDKKYSTDQDGTFAAIGDGGETLMFEDMQPDLPKTGLLVFDVPKKLSKDGLLEVGDLFGGGEAYIDLGL